MDIKKELERIRGKYNQDGAPKGNKNAAGPHDMTKRFNASSISTKSRMTGETITIDSIKQKASDSSKSDEVIQDAMDLAFDNPVHFYSIKHALGGKLADQFEWEMGSANTNAIEEVVKPAIEKAKNDLKAKIPSPAKNKESSAVINGQKITFYNARNAGTNKEKQPRFIDISISDPDTGERLGSYAADDYESAMRHVYRIAGLQTR